MKFQVIVEDAINQKLITALDTDSFADAKAVYKSLKLSKDVIVHSIETPSGMPTITNYDNDYSIANLRVIRNQYI
jgi:hypothetical protein